MTPDICEFLEWDTGYFGFRIGRVKDHHLTGRSARDILEWVKINSIDCLYFLAEFDDPETIRLAHIHGFQLVDIRVTLEYNLKNIKRYAGKTLDLSDKVIIQQVQSEDIPPLKLIAETSYGDTRFHFDRRFPKDKSDGLYEIWIEKSCTGYADHVLVAKVDAQVVGYIACKILGDRKGQISLIAVSEKARGQGVGKSLINSSLDWFVAQGIDVAEVATQGRNIRGQRLYQGCGFLTQSVRLWYHRWTAILENQAS